MRTPRILTVLPLWAAGVLCFGAGIGFAADAELPVLPGLNGLGVDTPAGRGGRVYTVKNLSGAGFGSLRDALAQEEPRTIVFEVGGVIDLEGHSLTIEHPRVTIAGQTAPAPGITLIRGGLIVKADDVLVQHIAVRPGTEGPVAHTPGDSPDLDPLGDLGGDDTGLDVDIGMAPVPKDNFICPAVDARGSRIVFDHCSFSWSTHMLVTFVRPDKTFSHCIFAESLVHPGSSNKHKNWGRGQAMGMFGYEGEVALIGCLWANNGERQPLVRKGNALIVNNLYYNPLSTPIGADIAKRYGIVNTVMIAGPITKPGSALTNISHQAVFMQGCAARDAKGNALPVRGGRDATYLDDCPFPPESAPARPVPTDRVEAYVLANAGMRPAKRDAVDARLIRDIERGAGALLKSQDQVGGYPAYEPTRRAVTLPANPSDDDDGDGYTNLEEWLHKLAAELEQPE